MAEGRQRSEWGQTAELLAVLINANRDPKKSKSIESWQVNPFGKKPRPRVADAFDKAMLREAFGRKNKP